MAGNTRTRILLAFASIIFALAALLWWLTHQSRRDSVTAINVSNANDPRTIPPVAEASSTLAPPSISTPLVKTPEQNVAQIEGISQDTRSPESRPSNTTQPAPSTVSTPPAVTSGSTPLVVPVAGVRPDQLRDTFTDARSQGRVHDAIDIPAPRNTPALAAADGTIIKLFHSERGGMTIYQLSADKRMIYYYAHLDHYAENIAEGHFARQGEVIAYVGDTGNAGAGNYHLHFSISIIADPKRYWDGVNINPYPLLRK